ncbi:MAG: carboxypeptidase regulatory-like domain-containing protein [Planctomycetes bacterium]|nr:carboxypeptidase regulatory-like domain-containing protein [Planctomycetota bacterium]
MQKQTLVLLLVALAAVAAGAFILPSMFDEPEAPVMQWDASEEVEGSEPEPTAPDTAETASFERTEAELAPGAAVVSDEPRIDAILRGRVIDKFQQPVAGHKVWLEIGRSRQQNARGGRAQGGPDRGGRSRRIPDPVVTNAEGLFAFQGQAFTSLRVTLQVKSNRHAAGLFEKDVGDIRTGQASAAEAEVALGDLVLKSGGVVRGRVTDLDGNAVPNAQVTIEPDFRNRMRWQRNRADLLPPITTDLNGSYVYANVPEGSFAVTVLAKMHTPGRSETFEVAEDGRVDVPDIKLGPGYEVTGFVKDARGEPIAGADVRLRASLSANAAANENAAENGERRGRGGRGGGRGGRGGFGGFGGRDHRTETDEQGRFFLEHLPGSLMEIQVDAKGFLDYEADEINPKVNRPVYVTMLDGLRIAGIVQNPDGLPLTSYAVRAVRLRGLPDPSKPEVDLNELWTKMTDPNLSDDARRTLMRQMRDMRDQFGSQFRNRGGDRGGRGGERGGDRGGRGGRNRTAQEQHDGGRFVVDGLQEGVYEVIVEAAQFARYQSAEIQVRSDAPPPELTITVDPGVYVGGVVVDAFGDPIAGAEVTLSSATLESNAPPTAPTGNGRQGGRGGFDFNRMAREWMRGTSGPPLRLQARTDQDGLFIVKNAQRGIYTLTASADGFANDRTEAFQLDADRSDFKLRLQPLGVIVGTVTGFLPEEIDQVQVGVMLMPEDGNFMSAMMRGGRGGRGGGGGRGMSTSKVESDGSYRIEGLTPGNYVVRSWMGSTRDFMRQVAPSFLAGGLQADVAVNAGEEARWDMQLTRPQVGKVIGTVMHNGTNAAGFRVELRNQANDTQQPAGGNPMMARMRNFGRNRNDTVSGSGTFELNDVPAGLYTLRITADRRGGVLHEEPLQVVADVTVERSFSLTTGSVKGTITTDDGSDPKAIGGRISLVPGIVEVPQDLNNYLRQNSSFDARVRDGAFEVASIPAGSYLLIAQLRDRERTTQQVVVNGAANITVLAGKATQQNGGGPK